jgi:catechol 2,3-dioxygenase-like lactoylglutathione lyase family enzyme
VAQPTGMHHIAVMAADIKKHIAFFSEVLGCPLVALFDMHGVPGGLHAFLRLNEDSYFSVVQLPGVGDIPIEIGRTHSGTGAGICAPGTLQHLAFNVDSVGDLIAMRDRIRSHGVNVIGPIDHGFCQSIYLGGPDQMTLEVATTTSNIDPRLWIDPSTVAQAGIVTEELAAYKCPPSYSGPSPVAQPPYDPAKPHQAFPIETYLKRLALSDQELSAGSAYAEPPVRSPS